MSDNRGIFSLEEFYNLQVSGETTNIFDTFRYVNSLATDAFGGPAFGYMCGGRNPSASPSDSVQTRIDRIDYSNDTANTSPKGALSHRKNNHAAVGNKDYLYNAGGGYGSPTTSKIDRTDYGNDTATAVVKGPLTSAKYYLASVGNASYGYFASGYWNKTFVDRVDYANDTPTASPKGPLSSGRYGAAGTANASYGWIAGNRYPFQSIVDRIDFASDTATSSPRGPLASSNGYKAGTGNSNFGYFHGGYGGQGYSKVERIDYSNDTATATVVTTFSSPERDRAGATGDTSFGYFAGGASGNKSSVQKIDYNNDTATMSPKGPLSAGRYGLHGGSGRENGLAGDAVPIIPATRTEIHDTAPVGTDYGYWAAGNTNISPHRYSLVERIDFNNDTATASPRGNLAAIRYNGGGTGNTGFGYHGAGRNSGVGPSAISAVDRVDYANDSAVAAPKGPVTLGRWMVAAFGNASYGYWGGGRSPSPVSTVDRADFSNDTPTTSTKGPLTIAGAVSSGGTGNQNYGYVGGGDSPTRSTIQKIDYSNDTATATNVATTGINGNPNRGMAATGNHAYGYWGGGDYDPNEVTYMRRLDYSNDTANATPKGNLTAARYKFSATGNSSYGYWGGGAYDTAPGFTTIDRLDYANDTATTVTKGPLATGRWGSTSTSSRESGLPTTGPGPVTVDKGADGYTTTTSGPAYGYFAGSYNNRSSVDRVDYNNDTATASPKGNLPSDASQGGGAGNRSYGYTFTGWAPGIATTVYRVDYANDTAAAATKGPVSKAGNYARSVGNANYGYTGGRGGGGVGPVDTSIIDRVDYANDTATATVVNPAGMVPGATVVAAVGNQSYGYFAGGSPGTSVVRRLDYSSDTTATSPKGPLSAARASCSPGTGNADYGYVLGRNPSQGPSTDVERIDYSNDTATALMRGKLSLNPSNAYATSQSGVSNPTYAYFGGGDPASTHVDRIEFSNDTSNASPKGNLATARKSPYSFSAQNSGLPSTTYIPRIRWVDSAAEAPATPVGGPAFGYWLGSYPYTSVVDKMDFSNDTANLVNTANSTWQALGLAGTSSITHGYWAGGWVGGETTTGNRIDYSSDTGTLPVKGNLTVARRWHMAVGNASSGYQAGGFPSISSIDKIDYSNDTTASAPGANLTTIRNGSAGAGNKSYGYFAGGKEQPATVSIVERLDYSSDTSATTPKGNLPTGKFYKAGASNSDYGWYTGGSSGTTVVDRIDYSNDTATASPKGNLSAARYAHGATGSPSYGYFGGNDGPGNGTSTDRIDYSNDTATATPKGNFSVTWRKGSGGVSAQENANPTPGPGVAAPVQPPFPYPVQLFNPAEYISGGYTLGSGSNVQKINYSNDTATAIAKGPLAAAISYHSAVSSNSHGYTFGGSPSPSYRSIVQRVSYANDTATALTVANLAQPVYRTYSGMGNKTYGYQSGGQRPSTTGTSQIDRIEYANDTATGLQKGYLVASRYLQTACGNLNYGYVCGGSPSHQNNSVVQRTDYANDTATAVRKGDLHQGSRKLAATGTASYGYVAGGTNPDLSSTTRIDYANDTATSVQKGSMTVTRENFGAMSSPAYGYYTGGSMPWPQPSRSSTDRIDYSNDTATATPKGILAVGVSYFSAASGADIAGALQ